MFVLLLLYQVFVLLLNNSWHGDVVLVVALPVYCLLLRHLRVKLARDKLLLERHLVVRLHRWKTLVALHQRVRSNIVLIRHLLLILGLI